MKKIFFILSLLLLSVSAFAQNSISTRQLRFFVVTTASDTVPVGNTMDGRMWYDFSSDKFRAIVNGVVITLNESGGGGGSVNFANNGVSLSGDTVQLGGDWTKDTQVGSDSLHIAFFPSSGTPLILIQNLQNAGGAAISLVPKQFNGLTYDATHEFSFDANTEQYFSKIFAHGGNVIIDTDIAGGIGIDRLTIDSVGNISMPNTANFTLTTEGSLGNPDPVYTQSTSQFKYENADFQFLGINGVSNFWNFEVEQVASTVLQTTDLSIDINGNSGSLGQSLVSNGTGGVIWGSMFDKTIDTTAGDAATIDKISGRFRKDTSGTTFTLTNSRITANSIILLTPANASIDATATHWTVSAGTGSATITFNAAPSANFDMNFLVVN